MNAQHNRQPPRSYLFVPGNRPERFDKAMASGAHAVVIDLEDAVPEADKQLARNAVSKWLTSRPVKGAAQVLVRVNASMHPGFEADLAVCRSEAVSGVMLPKAETLHDLTRVHGFFRGDVSVLPLIESARGFGNLALLAAGPGVQRLVFGTIDFQLDMGVTGDDTELLYFRSRMVLESRIAHLLPPVDGVTTDLHDTDRLHGETERCRRLGFGAKLCIHPKQVVAVNAAFQPTPAELAWARRVVSAAEGSGGSAVNVDGQMVDLPVILKAQQLLAAAASSLSPLSEQTP